MPDPRHLLGLRAEKAAAVWLERSGWQVLARRWRNVGGELDLVCLDPDGALVGVEVKLRRSPRAGSAAESLGRTRVARLRSTLVRFHAASGLHQIPAMRLDLVTVTPAEDGRWRLSRLAGIDAW